MGERVCECLDGADGIGEGLIAGAAPTDAGHRREDFSIGQSRVGTPRQSIEDDGRRDESTARGATWRKAFALNWLGTQTSLTIVASAAVVVEGPESGHSQARIVRRSFNESRPTSLM